MPKRKRNSEPSLYDKLTKHLDEVSRALKAAKGFERQRLSKRTHEAGATAEKKERLEREISVLKNLDLHQTARAHLYSSLLKVKSIAASADLPDEIRRGVSRPDLPEDERAALHNVTSGLYNREPVKQAVDRAITTVCASLGVAAPEKKGGKRVREGKKERGGGEDQPLDGIPAKKTKLQAETTAAAAAEEKEEGADVEMGGQVVGVESNEEGGEEEEVTDFEGFESDVDEPGPAIGDPGSEDEAADEAADEKRISKYDHLLGGSSDDDDDDGEGSEGSGWDEELLAKYRGRETVNLDDISLSGGSEGEEQEGESQGSESDVEEDAASQLSLSSSSSRSASPLPAKKNDKTKKKHRERREPGPTRAGETTFLPSLMGGYVSGSESASDVEAEVAPAKKRRGQRARQAIWEKKFGAKARHLQEQQAGKGKGEGGGRDSGWDMRRGAVDGDDDARTPWKRGVRTPFGTGGGGCGNGGGQTAPTTTPKPTKRDDEGKLHGSWEAAKKAKEAQKAAVFAGSKVTFD